MAEANPFRKDDNPFRVADDINAQLAAREAKLDKQEGPVSAFGDSIARSVMDMVLQSPNLLAGGAAGIQGAADFVTGGEFDFNRRFEEEQGKFPANLATTTNRAGAAIRAFTGEFGQRGPDQPGVENPVPLFMDRIGPRFDDELLRINEEEERVREKFPTATTLGDIGGVGVSLALGRFPLSKSIKSAEQKLTKTALNVPAGAKGFINETLKGSAARSIARGVGRTVETGLEAAVIELIRGENPFELAGYAMAAQASGSAILGATKLAGKNPLLVSALGLAALLQVAKETLPGGRDSFIASIEEGFKHVQLGLVLGAMAGVVGGGRLRDSKGALERNFPAFADSIQSISRTTMIALAGDYFDATPDEQQTIDATLTQLQQDPEFFGPEITARLLKAMQEGNLTEALREVQ